MDKDGDQVEDDPSDDDSTTPASPADTFATQLVDEDDNRPDNDEIDSGEVHFLDKCISDAEAEAQMEILLSTKELNNMGHILTKVSQSQAKQQYS